MPQANRSIVTNIDSKQAPEKGVTAQRIIDSIRDYAVFMLDTGGCVVSWNHGASRLMGYRPQDIIGNNFSSFYPTETRQSEPQKALVEATRHGHYHSEGWQVRKDGQRFWASISIDAVHRGNGAVIGFAEVARDTTHEHHGEEAHHLTPEDLERRVMERTKELSIRNTELERLADTDCLTGIWNRRGFMRLADQEIRRAERYRKPFAVLFVDLDDFKTINDVYGHAAGDEALKTVVSQMTHQLRDGDVMARIGGDEFVLLLLETSVEGAVKMADRLCAGVVTAFAENSGADFRLTLSIGVAQWQQHESIDQLLARADAALYEAKAAKTDGCVVASPETPLPHPLPHEISMGNADDFQGDVLG